MAGRFRLYTDADVDGPVVKALSAARWDVLRGIDAYPERTRDDVHFARAAREGRILVSNDRDMKAIAVEWFAEGRSFPGPVWWPRSHYAVMSPGDFVDAFEELACQDAPFEASRSSTSSRDADPRPAAELESLTPALRCSHRRRRRASWWAAGSPGASD